MSAAPVGGAATAPRPASVRCAMLRVGGVRLITSRPGLRLKLGRLGDDDAIAGLDLDTCINGAGAVALWAVQQIRPFKRYTEVSPCGGGAKLLFRYHPAILPMLQSFMGGATQGKQRKRCGGGGAARLPAVELLFSNKFFVVTDRHLPSTPDLIRLEQAEDLLRLIRVTGPRFARGEGEADAEAGDCTRYDHSSNGGKSDLMRRLHRKMAFDAHLHRRWHGDFEGLKNASGCGRAMNLGAALKRAGFSKEETAALLRVNPQTTARMSEKGDAAGAREFGRVWKNAGAERRDGDDVGGGPPGEDGRPTIRVVAGDIERMVDEAEDALLAADLGLYQWGAIIVRPGLVRVAVYDDRSAAAQRIPGAGGHALLEVMTASAAWKRIRRALEDLKSHRRSVQGGEAIPHPPGRWRLPVLPASSTLRPCARTAPSWRRRAITALQTCCTIPAGSPSRPSLTGRTGRPRWRRSACPSS